MTNDFNILVADSSGNVTIMVLTKTERSDYKAVAQELLKNKSLGGEQVAFILPDDTAGELPRMEMCGLEFCGNASRAFAFYEAVRSNHPDFPPAANVTVSVSGCEYPLDARIYEFAYTHDVSENRPTEKNGNIIRNHLSATVSMDMPVPSGTRLLTANELGIQENGTLVDIDGISHLILTDIAPSAELFDSIKSRIYENISPELPALGIMFCDTVNDLMTPVVYVRDVDTTYFEGSCASGSVAASFALAEKLPDGIHEFTLNQPEGALYTSVTKEKDLIRSISLKGLVTLSNVITVSI